MPINRGKQFEAILKQDWHTSFPGSFLFRIPDQVSGYQTTSQNPCDFIGFTNGKLFLIECKSIEGNTINFSLIRQYDRLLKYKNLADVYPGILIWYRDHDKVIWVPITEAEKMKKAGAKSINIKMLDESKYHIINVPSKKKRVFMESDYRILVSPELYNN